MALTKVQAEMGQSNAPAFAAYQSSIQTLSSNVTTKILFETEEFDTNNNFASSRFTPTVAGYYQINAAVFAGAAASQMIAYIYKNGSVYKSGTNSSGAYTFGVTVHSLVYCNGTTDYIEIYANYTTGQILTNAAAYTYFNGALVRAA